MIPDPDDFADHSPEPGSDNSSDPEQEIESKSQRKRNAHQITQLAGMLVEMKPKARNALPIEPSILEAIKHCAEIKAHGARKRQLHFVSKLLRDTANVQELQTLVMHPELAKKKQADNNPHLAFRNELVENFADAVDRLREKYPNVELQQVRQLVRNAHNEYKKAEAARKAASSDAEIEAHQLATPNNTKAAKSLLKLLTAGG